MRPQRISSEPRRDRVQERAEHLAPVLAPLVGEREGARAHHVGVGAPCCTNAPMRSASGGRDAPLAERAHGGLDALADRRARRGPRTGWAPPATTCASMAGPRAAKRRGELAGVDPRDGPQHAGRGTISSRTVAARAALEGAAPVGRARLLEGAAPRERRRRGRRACAGAR